jgi:hypothetical protein
MRLHVLQGAGGASSGGIREGPYGWKSTSLIIDRSRNSLPMATVLLLSLAAGV